METLLAWLQDHQILLLVTSGISLLLFIATLVFIPIFVARIPADYFTGTGRAATSAIRHPASAFAGRIVKNVVGVFLILAGIAMLVLPGQGIITILIGLAFLDFPGKQRLEQRLVRQPHVFRTLNWIRQKAGRPPLLLP